MGLPPGRNRAHPAPTQALASLNETLTRNATRPNWQAALLTLRGKESLD
jgi:hypothetical protein